MLFFLFVFELQLRKLLGKIVTFLGEVNPQLLGRRIIKEVGEKILETTLLFIDYFKTSDYIHG